MIFVEVVNNEIPFKEVIDIMKRICVADPN